jgi:c-di-GMP-binding flagellar brake protein YcgR
VVSLQVFGKVVRVNPVQEDGKQGYEVAVEFLNLHEDYREWIITYVFQMQRESIRGKRKSKNA